MDYFEDIQQIVCLGEGYLPKELQSKTRKREIVVSRQLVMYFMKEYSGETWSAIGGHYGKDHATAMHSHKTIGNLKDTDRKISVKVSMYNSKIKDRIDFEINILTDNIEDLKTRLISCIENGKPIDHTAISVYNRLLELIAISAPT